MTVCIKRSMTLMSGLIAAFMVFAMLLVSTAQAATLKTLQAEDMNRESLNVLITSNDATPYPTSSPNSVRYDNRPRSISQTVQIDGTTENITVWAKASSSSVMRLYVDGQRYGSDKTVANDPFLAYNWNSTDFGPGSHTIEVENVSGANLKVDKVVINGTATTTPPVDTDGDGVNDDVDQCDNEAGPASNNGCPVVAPVDTDGDGVNDDVDQCDNQPGPASNNGCPVVAPVDTDGDGVTDDVDQCDTQAGPASNNGCPVTEPSGEWTWPASADVTIRPGDDIDAKINSAPANSVVKVYSDADGEYTYNASAVLDPANNVDLHAQPGTFTQVGGAGKGIKPNPAVHIVVTHSGDNGMRMSPDSTIRGFDLSGVNPPYTDTGSGSCAGKGSFIAGGGGNANNVYEFNRIHDNAAVGISNVEGKVLRNEFTNNTTNDAFLGCNAGAVKGSVEFEAAYNYVHNELGNGIWCDNGCENEPARTNGAWFHDNAIADIGSAGIRAEELPDINPESDPYQISVLIEDNIIGGSSQRTGRGDIHVHDSSNVTARDNVLSVRSLDGHGAVPASSGANLRASDSCRSDRPDTGDPRYGAVRFTNNDLNGGVISVEEARYNDGDIILTGNTEVGSVRQEGTNSCG